MLKVLYNQYLLVMFFAVETRKATLNMIHITLETIKIKLQTDRGQTQEDKGNKQRQD